MEKRDLGEAERQMKALMGLIIFPVSCVCNTSLEKPKTTRNLIFIRTGKYPRGHSSIEHITN